MYLDEMDLTADSIYKKVQAKTMKAKLNAIIDKENAQDNWSELINHLYDYSKSLTKRSRENLEKLRFCAYYAISLNFFEIKSSDLQFLDNIMANYLNALSEYGFRGEELITLYSTIEQEEKRIKCLANYLISIEVNFYRYI